MLAEDDENIRPRAVDKILELRSEASATTDMESSTLESSRKDVVRQFKVPKTNVEATRFYEITNLDSIKDISQPPAVMDLDDTSIASSNADQTSGPAAPVSQPSCGKTR